MKSRNPVSPSRLGRHHLPHRYRRTTASSHPHGATHQSNQYPCPRRHVECRTKRPPHARLRHVLGFLSSFRHCRGAQGFLASPCLARTSTRLRGRDSTQFPRVRYSSPRRKRSQVNLLCRRSPFHPNNSCPTSRCSRSSPRHLWCRYHRRARARLRTAAPLPDRPTTSSRFDLPSFSEGRGKREIV